MSLKYQNVGLLSSAQPTVLRLVFITLEVETYQGIFPLLNRGIRLY